MYVGMYFVRYLVRCVVIQSGVSCSLPFFIYVGMYVRCFFLQLVISYVFSSLCVSVFRSVFMSIVFFYLLCLSLFMYFVLSSVPS